MKIYTNHQYEILSLDTLPSFYMEPIEFEVTSTREEMFGNLCDAVIRGYKYEPVYEMLFNEDGSNARDEITHELLYKVDENGEKIFQGYACYPFVDYHTLMLIQKQYEDSQRQAQTFDSQISHLSKMSGIGVEAGITIQPTLEELKKAKRAEVNAACGQIICNGITVELSIGFEHFSLSQTDQLNLFGLQAQIASGVTQIIYHADGQPCRFYPASDITLLIEKAMFHASYHTTYANSLRSWIDGAEMNSELETIYYGVDVPEEYQSEVLKAYLAQITAITDGAE